MKSRVRNKARHLFLFFLVFVMGSCIWPPSSVEAKIYIDVSSPGIRQLPVSIISKGHVDAKKIEWVIKGDL